MMHFTSARHAALRGTPGWWSRLTALAALAVLLNASWRVCRDTHARRLAGRPNAKPETLQVWEDEGGQSQMPKAPPP